MRFIPVVFFIFILNPASAEPVTLNQVVQESLTQSPAVAKARAAARESDWHRRERLDGFLPVLTANASYLLDKRYMLITTEFNGNPVTFPNIVPTTSYTLTAQWSLFDGFASTYAYKAAGRQADAAHDELDWQEFSTERQTALLYYKAVAARSLKDVAYQNLSTLKDHQKDIMALRKAGISTKYDVLRTDTQVSEAEAEILNAEDNYEMSKFRLGEILGKEKEARDITGALPVPDVRLVNKVERLNVENRRDLQAMNERVTGLRYQDKSDGRFWAPRISFFGQYEYYNNLNDRFNDYNYFRDANQIGLQLTWNIFDGMRSISKSEETYEQVHQMEKTLQQTLLKASSDFEFWKRKFNYYCTVYKSRSADIDRSTEAVRLAREGRKVGARTTSDMLDAELDLFRARAGLVNAQVGAVEALINLELASGQKLYDLK
jgi:outer membrane protein TolC